MINDKNVIYESTSEDNTSCEENKEKVKLVKKSSSQYKKPTTNVVENLNQPFKKLNKLGQVSLLLIRKSK